MLQIYTIFTILLDFVTFIFRSAPVDLSAPFSSSIRVKQKIRYLFDPPLGVGTPYSHSYPPWASPMAIHSWIRFHGSLWKESMYF